MRKLYCEDCDWHPETVEEATRLNEHHVSENETVTVCHECHRKRHNYVKRGGGYISRTGNPHVKTEIIRIRVSKEEKRAISQAAAERGWPMSRLILRACLASGEIGEDLL